MGKGSGGGQRLLFLSPLRVQCCMEDRLSQFTTVVGDPVLLNQPRVHFSGRTPNSEES